jgi:hypothetical protein
VVYSAGEWLDRTLMPAKRRRPERAHQYEGSVYCDLQKRLATNVVAVRTAHGWTQEAAAYQCEMPTRLLQAVEASGANVTLTTLARLCQGLRVDARRLLTPMKR